MLITIYSFLAFRCRQDDCNQHFSSRYALQKHIHRIHDKPKVYQVCMSCMIGFISLYIHVFLVIMDKPCLSYIAIVFYLVFTETMVVMLCVRLAFLYKMRPSKTVVSRMRNICVQTVSNIQADPKMLPRANKILITITDVLTSL